MKDLRCKNQERFVRYTNLKGVGQFHNTAPIKGRNDGVDCIDSKRAETYKITGIGSSQSLRVLSPQLKVTNGVLRVLFPFFLALSGA